LARKILLADDSVTAQNMGRKILADAGYEVLTVNNGSAALKKVAETKPDLIVLDVYMPGYSGLEVCQRLKEVGETARIPVLLTVGKLEPFKPEEAKRVRADGFIVKPFEASELLSVLTKLEDKIVPRAETSKPGRFARAIAAVEEGRYDKTMAIEEDSGWKNRIAFPSGKKKKNTEPENVDDPAIYNPINKDLRTILDRKPEPAHEAKPEAAKVDLGALTPDGLPKDVTPEEIAALAAAAAQIQGAAVGQDQRSDQPEESRVDAVSGLSQPAAETSSSDSQPEAKAEAQAESTLESTEDLPKVEPAQFEEGKQDPANVEAAGEAVKEAPVAADSSHSADVVAASPVEPAMFPLAEAEDAARDHSESYSYAAAAEPMTMAAAAGADSNSSRWMAIPIALLPEEVAISLEHEMQKAHAAFAAAEMAQASVPKPGEDSVAWAPPAAAEAPVPEESHNQANLEATGSAAAESISAVVRELEARAAALLAEQGASAGEPETSYLRPAEPKTSSWSEPEGSSQEKIGESPIVENAPTPVSSEAEPAVSMHPTGLERQSDISPAEATNEPEEVKAEGAGAPAELSQAPAVENQVEPAPSAVSAELSSAVPAEERAAQTGQESPSAEAAISETQSQDIPAEPAASAVAESAPIEASHDNAAAAAAAGSKSWRQIRDLPNASHSSANDEAADSKDGAAMAVAAGAEHLPQEAAESPDSGDPTEIANIVDSVLADLRPRIVAEISKKMGKKK
jgi:two-component system chemotaxis response regulator CheY